MFDWLKNIIKQIKEINTSVNEYKKETDNQVLPSAALINRAKKHMEKSKYLEAKDLLYEALVIAPNDALIYKYIGECEEKLGDNQSAEKTYKLSAQLNSQDKNIWHKLGLVQINLKKYEQAEKSFEKADKVSPINTDVQTGWGMSLLKQGKNSQALEKFTKAIQINHYNFSAMLLAAIVEIRMEKYDEADQKLSFLNKTNPTEGSCYEYANLCFIKNRYDDAIKFAKKSVEINPNMFPGYVMLGKLYSIRFDYENSIKNFTEAENRNLTNALLYTEWGDALIRFYKFDSAIEKFNKALECESENNVAKSGLALCYAQLKNFDRAQEHIKSLEENAFKHIHLSTAKGIIFYNEGEYDKAISQFKEILKDYKNEYSNYYSLAKCYEALKNTDMVKDSYDKYIKANPDYAPVYLDYAKYLMSTNDYKDAQRKLRKAETLDKNNQEILNLLFYTSYILVKENVCEYNVKEAITLANRIEDFKYPELRAELEEILKTVQQ